MTDTISKEQRSKTMSAIRSQSELENLFTKELWRRNLRFRKNVRKLMGNPDIAIQKFKVVIFVDSCFWHGCPLHYRRPKSNQEFWDKKIARNIERDREVTDYYISNKWYIMRVWEHEIKTDLDSVIEETIEFINTAKKSALKDK